MDDIDGLNSEQTKARMLVEKISDGVQRNPEPALT
jgi:hypothetical protein